MRRRRRESRVPFGLSRFASLVVAAGYAIAWGVFGGPEHVPGLWVAFGVLAALALIWFPEAFGNYTGPVRHGYIDEKTPPEIVAVAGWFILVGLPIIVFWVIRSQRD